MTWVSLLVNLLMGGALLAAGVAARNASKPAAVAFAAAGLASLLMTCCSSSAAFVGTVSAEVRQALMLAGTVNDALVVVLIVVGLVSISKAVQRAQSS